MTKSEINLLLHIGQRLAITILENGGETYRAEDVVMRACSAYGIDTDVLALPTGIFISIRTDDGVFQSLVKRVKKRGVNLSRVDAANNISRLLACKSISFDDALAALDALYAKKTAGRLIPCAASFLSAACFCILFGGGWFDSIVAGLGCATVQFIAMSFKREDMFRFIISLIGGAISAIFAAAAVSLFGMGNSTMMISAAIMPLLPGLALVNAIRDTVHGDLVSGMARLGEVLMTALSITAGVSSVLGLWNHLGYIPDFARMSVQIDSRTLLDYLKIFVFCFGALYFFSFAAYAPTRTQVVTGLIGASGYVLYFLFKNLGVQQFMCYFLATAVLALLCELCAIWQKTPATTFISTSILGLVPGLDLYRTMQLLTLGEYQAGGYIGIAAVISIGTMAIAVALSVFVMRVRSRYLASRLDQRR